MTSDCFEKHCDVLPKGQMHMIDQLVPDDPDLPLLHPVTGEELPPSTSWYEWLAIADREISDDERWALIQSAARYKI